MKNIKGLKIGRTDRAHLEVKSINLDDGYILFMIVSKDDVLKATAAVAFNRSCKYSYEINGVQTYANNVDVRGLINNILSFDRFTKLMGA